MVPQSERLKIGDCVVDIARREILAPNRMVPTRITLKSLQVLLMLVNHGDKVVSRETLLGNVWRDTLPTDDVLTQAITQLRRAFGDNHESPRYVETIAKGGYRLLAPIAWLPDLALIRIRDGIPPTDATGAPSTTKTSSPLAIGGGRIFGLLLLVALLSGLAITKLAVQDEGTKPGSSTQPNRLTPVVFEVNSLTSRPGRETQPAISPDGSMVAYEEVSAGSASSVIMLQTTAVVPPRQLTHPDAQYKDFMPAWSPDGRSLAFVRRGGAEKCRVMLVAASGDDERAVGPCYADTAGQFDWTPDGRGLLMGGTKYPHEDRSPLRLLDLATGKWRKLPYPVAAGDIDIDPHYSPDGKWIVFRRNVSLSDLWKMHATGGRPQRLSDLKGDIRGWDWTLDGTALIYSFIEQGGAALYHYEMREGRTVKLTRTDEMIMVPDVAAHAPAIVFEINRSKSGIFRYPLAAGRSDEALPPTQIFASSGSDMMPSVSPDGRRLAFVSNRSIRTNWWVGEIGKPASPKPIARIEPIARHAPVWSADGKAILVIGHEKGRPHLFEVDVESGRVRRLPVNDGIPTFAGYVSEVDRLLVGVDAGEGKPQLRLYNTSAQPWRVLAAIDGVSFARYNPDTDKIYFTKISQPGLWSVDVRLRQEAIIDSEFPKQIGYRRWDFGLGGIHYMLPSDDCKTGWARLPITRATGNRCLDALRDALGAPDVDPVGRWIYVAIPITDNVDIGFAQLPDMRRPTN